MKRKVLNIVSVLLGLLLLNGGLNKFLNYMPLPEDFPEPIARDNEALMEIMWLMPLIAFAEIFGRILILSQSLLLPKPNQRILKKGIYAMVEPNWTELGANGLFTNQIKMGVEEGMISTLEHLDNLLLTLKK